MHISIGHFGKIEDKDILEFTLTTPHNHQIQILNFGGIVHSWLSPDRFGVYSDILLGCKDLDGYLGEHPYFGCIVGRFANRIDHGKFTLDGLIFQLPTNLPPHHLHGGIIGWHKKVLEHQIFQEKDQITILLTGKSPDGDEGYPGQVEFIVSYTYTADNQLIIEYRAMTSKATPINMTNHAYFNLSGDQNSDIFDHQVLIYADQCVVCKDDLIPTGQLASVSNTLLDLRSEKKTIGQIMDKSKVLFNKANGFDHCYVLKENRDYKQEVATVFHPFSGRRLQVFTSEPAIQLYCGNWLEGIEGKSGAYKEHAGLCLETQHFPDSPNHAHFPNTILRPDELYYSKTIYKVDVLQE